MDFQNKKIFGYFNGTKQVFADPLVLDRDLRVLMGGDCNKVVEKYNSENPVEQAEAAKVFLPAIAKAFGVPKLFDPNNGAGWLEEDLVALWDQWTEWVDQKKNPPVTPPTSSPPMAAPGLPRRP